MDNKIRSSKQILHEMSSIPVTEDVSILNIIRESVNVSRKNHILNKVSKRTKNNISQIIS